MTGAGVLFAVVLVWITSAAFWIGWLCGQRDEDRSLQYTVEVQGHAIDALLDCLEDAEIAVEIERMVRGEDGK